MDFKNITLTSSHKIEKAKRRAQSMIWSSFSGTNGIEYANAFDLKTNSNIIYIHPSDEEAFLRLNGNECFNTKIKILPTNFKKLIMNMNDNDWINGFHHGALYLPYPYVCSTFSKEARFSQEQYYWDSYLYVLSLLSFNQINDAKGLILNLCYQIDKYGMVLNGNRTYYYWRSQPPLLSTMVMSVYTYLEALNKMEAKQWLKLCQPYIKQELIVWEKYGFKTFLYNNKEIKLASYFDTLNKICPEAIDEQSYLNKILGQPINFQTYYKIKCKYPDMKNLFITLKGDIYFQRNIDPRQLLEFESLYHELTKNIVSVSDDNANRASGFDPSFAAFENHCTDITPICLNSLLYKTMSDLEMIGILLQQGSEIYTWRHKKNILANDINLYLWNKKFGIFQNRYISNHNFTKIPFITTIYPMMFGLANEKQAKLITKYIFENFLTPFGIKNVKNPGKDQWDNIWGIMNYFTNKALRMYGQYEKANKIAILFINNVIEVFYKTNTFFEKYNPTNGSQHFNFKHYGNQDEFSWTAAALLTLLARLK